VLGLLSTAVLWFFRAQISWPSIVWGIGCMFLLVTLASGIGPLAIPGTIFTGLGLLLAWQNYSHDWASWAFAWALIPALVGLGLVLAFIRSRGLRIIGLSILAWSLVAFAFFGLFFAGQGVMVKFWPAALIMAGLVVLFQAYLARTPIKKQP
jgi:hypothetical protein